MQSGRWRLERRLGPGVLLSGDEVYIRRLYTGGPEGGVDMWANLAMSYPKGFVQIAAADVQFYFIESASRSPPGLAHNYNIC